jgi:hypothetical protein
MLTQLVLEDYVKLRGPLFYRLVCALADMDDDVRECAEHAVLTALGQRSRGLLHGKFIEVVLVTTGCASQPAFLHLLESSSGAAASAGADISSVDLDAASAGSLQVRRPSGQYVRSIRSFVLHSHFCLPHALSGALTNPASPSLLRALGCNV